MRKKIDLSSFIEEYDGDKNPLLAFYEMLGFDGIKTLNPKKIKVNKEDNELAASTYIESGETKEDRNIRCLTWFQYGPSSDDKVKKGTVFCAKGWLV